MPEKWLHFLRRSTSLLFTNFSKISKISERRQFLAVVLSHRPHNNKGQTHSPSEPLLQYNHDKMPGMNLGWL